MRIIISPAKKMRVDTDSLPYRDLPEFLPKTEILAEALTALSQEELKKLWKCNDAIAALNVQRLAQMDLYHRLTPAILSYEGIQYQYMAPRVFTYEYFDYAQKHVRILSGLYGILRPFDAIVPYRLEMQAKLKTDFCKNLYDFWGESLYQELTKDSKIIINLASDEYSKAVKKYVQPTDSFITCRFCEQTEGKLVEKGVYVKMARGEMVRFMAEQNVQEPEAMKQFTGLGYGFSQEHSTEDLFTFVR